MSELLWSDGTARGSVRRDGHRLELSGEIDLDNAAEISDLVVAAVRAGVVELDLSRVTFCGAAGVHAILRAREARADGGALRVACSPAVFRVFALCGLSNLDGLTIALVPRAPSER
jgi:anti-anti-sigma factor